MTSEEAYNKCLNEKRRIEELEDLIFIDAHWSYCYARYIIQGPFENCEEAIIKNSHYSYYYARDIIKGHWKLGEEAISKHPEYSFWYILNVIREPFEKSHPVIFNSKYKHDYLAFLKYKNYDMNKISEWLL